MIVLIVMLVLGILAGRLAYDMKVETTLARHATFHPEMEWMGRSGVELATYILGQGAVGIEGSYDALNQKWAGGTGDTNSAVAWIDMDNFELGAGTISIKITDLDRKFNINVADDLILDQALAIIGVDAALAPNISDAIKDWRDPDDATQMSGAESDDYLANPNPGFPPYRAKNGPFDDITELLLVRGVTRAMFNGSSGGNYVSALPRVRPMSQSVFEEPIYTVGLADIFTTLSGRLLNINTASPSALTVLPAIDENIAGAIVTARAGPDGVEGNEDDMPFRSPAEMASRVPGFDPAAAQQLVRFFTVRSLVFEARITVNVGGNTREFVALIRRNNPRDVQVMNFYWH
jgi:general secretion pathway protein K